MFFFFVSIHVQGFFPGITDISAQLKKETESLSELQHKISRFVPPVPSKEDKRRMTDEMKVIEGRMRELNANLRALEPACGSYKSEFINVNTMMNPMQLPQVRNDEVDDLGFPKLASSLVPARRLRSLLQICLTEVETQGSAR